MRTWAGGKAAEDGSRRFFCVFRETGSGKAWTEPGGNLFPSSRFSAAFPEGFPVTEAGGICNLRHALLCYIGNGMIHDLLVRGVTVFPGSEHFEFVPGINVVVGGNCLLYTSDAADEL